MRYNILVLLVILSAVKAVAGQVDRPETEAPAVKAPSYAYTAARTPMDDYLETFISQYQEAGVVFPGLEKFRGIHLVGFLPANVPAVCDPIGNIILINAQVFVQLEEADALRLIDLAILQCLAGMPGEKPKPSSKKPDVRT